MGLDSFFRRSVHSNNKGIEFPQNINLCGGMFSGDGSEGSFRGKVYDTFIQDVTGQTLYEDKIEPAIIATMAGALRYRFEELKDFKRPEEVIYEEDYPITMHELMDLAMLFEFASEHELCLVGWW